MLVLPLRRVKVPFARWYSLELKRRWGLYRATGYHGVFVLHIGFLCLRLNRNGTFLLCMVCR